MILVTGATGHLGKSTIDFLLTKGISANNIAALIRDESKSGSLKEKGIKIIKGNYDDYASLVAAFKGIDKLLFVSASDIAKRGQQHENVVKAAKEAGVNHIIYTSFIRKNDTETSPIAFVSKAHIDTENKIKSSGLNYTILKNALYADMLPIFLGDKVLETGIFLPAGNGLTAFTTRLDIAEAAAHVLLTSGHENKEYNISSDNNFSFREVAEILGQLSGKQINYFSPSKGDYIETVTKAGMPKEYAEMFAAFSQAIMQGEFETNNSDLEKLLGRKPTLLKEYLKSAFFSNN
jgi:NAD(P)H dehydrogenase (quinone)